MALTNSDINTIGMLLETWRGFHHTRRRLGLYIGHCYVILAFIWLEHISRQVSEGSVQRLLSMFTSARLHYLFTFLQDKGIIVLTRQSGRNRYYTLTDQGRAVAAELLEGIEAKQSAFFTQYLS